MKIFKFGLILTLLTAFIFACSENTTTSNNTNAAIANGNAISNLVINSNDSAGNQSGVDELASARKIYTETCIKCHKEDGKGGITDIEGRRIKAPDFTSERHKNDKDSEYVETIENGAKEDGMPAFKGKISDDDIKNLVKYIRRNFQGKS